MNNLVSPYMDSPPRMWSACCILIFQLLDSWNPLPSSEANQTAQKHRHILQMLELTFSWTGLFKMWISFNTSFSVSGSASDSFQHFVSLTAFKQLGKEYFKISEMLWRQLLPDKSYVPYVHDHVKSVNKFVQKFVL